MVGGAGEPRAFRPIGRRAQIQDLVQRHTSRLSIPTCLSGVWVHPTPDIGHSASGLSGGPRRACPGPCLQRRAVPDHSTAQAVTALGPVAIGKIV